MSSVVVTSFYLEPKRHGPKGREQARHERAVKALSMSALESTTSSPFGITFTANKRDSNRILNSTCGAVSGRSISQNKWVSSTADNWGKSSSRTSSFVESDHSITNDSKQVSSPNSKLNGTIKSRASSFENYDNNTDKPVLRRWQPNSNSALEEEKIKLKNRNSAVSQGSIDKFRFKSVASLLSRTPWQNDFVKRSNGFKQKCEGEVNINKHDISHEESDQRKENGVLITNNNFNQRNKKSVNGHTTVHQTKSSDIVNGPQVYNNNIASTDRSHISNTTTSTDSKVKEKVVRPNTLKLYGNHHDQLDKTDCDNHLNGHAVCWNEPAESDNDPHGRKGQVSRSSSTSISNIWIKRQSEGLEENRSDNSVEKIRQNGSGLGDCLSAPTTERQSSENEEDMAYSSRYMNTKPASYRISSTNYDVGSYRSSSRQRLGSQEYKSSTSPEKSKSLVGSPERTPYRTLDSPASTRYTTSSSSYTSSYSSSKKTSDFGDDDIYSNRTSAQRGYPSSSSRDMSSTSSYRNGSTYTSSSVTSYKSIRKDSYEKDSPVSPVKSVDSAYDAGRYEARKYSGSKSSDFERKGSGLSGEDSYSRGRYVRGVTRQTSLGYDISGPTDSTYSSKYTSRTPTSPVKSSISDDYSSSSSRGTLSSSYSTDRKYGETPQSPLGSRGTTLYSKRETFARRFSEDLSHSRKDNTDGFEKSSFIRRSLRRGKSREKSEDEADDHSSGRLSRLRSSLKWSLSKDKEDDAKKEYTEDSKKEIISSPTFLKRSSKKKAKSSGTEGSKGSRPTSPTSDSDRGLSPERAGAGSPPGSKKKTDEKKDKISFFRKLRKSSRGHEEPIVLPTNPENTEENIEKESVFSREITDKIDIDTKTSSPVIGHEIEAREPAATVVPRTTFTDKSEGGALPVKRDVSLDELDVWKESLEKDIREIDSVLEDIKTHEMGNTDSFELEDHKDTSGTPSGESTVELIRSNIVVESKQISSLSTDTMKSEEGQTSEYLDKVEPKQSVTLVDAKGQDANGSATENDSITGKKLYDEEVLKSLNAPAKSLPKREEVLGSDIELISSVELIEPVVINEEKSSAKDYSDSYVVVSESVKNDDKLKIESENEDKSVPTIVEPLQDSGKNASSSRSRFVRTHGGAKARIREKKLRREQEEQMRALVASREESKATENTIATSSTEESSNNACNLPDEKPVEPLPVVQPEEQKIDDVPVPLPSNTEESRKDQLSTPTVPEPQVRTPKGKRKVLRRSRTLVNLPPAHDADTPKATLDDAAVMKRGQKIIRPRPRTLTQGVEPSQILSSGGTNDEVGVVEEKQLSLKELQQKFLSGNFEKKTSAAEKKEKAKEEKRSKVKRSRSGKRYKTITEGIAPSVLDAARQLSEHSDVEEKNVQNEHLSRLTAALSASTQDIKRQSFIVGENGSVPTCPTDPVSTSVEDLSKVDRSSTTQKTQQEKHDIFKTRKPTVEETGRSGSEENEVTSLSALRERFLQAIVDTEAKHKQKPFLRSKKKSSVKSRPHTICGLDDWTYQQISHSFTEAEPELETVANLQTPIKSGSVEIEEKELEEICKLEGLSPEELAAELGCDPSLHATSYEKSVHDRNAKALEEIRRKKKEETKENKPPSEPGVPKRTKSIRAASEDDSQKKRRSGVFEPVDIKQSDNNATETVKGEEKKVEKEETKINWDEESDLDYVSHHSSQLSNIAAGKRNIKPQRKHRSGANPLKSLSKRADLVDAEASQNKDENKDEEKEIETKTSGSSPYRGGSGISEKSLGQKLWRKVALANEAKSALKSIEDFSSVKLRKVKAPEERKKDEIGGFEGVSVSSILIHVKGRRHVQCRVTEFSASSFNCGDSFIIVTPTSLHCWHGRQANVIEKAKAAEVASRIQQKKEMGCKALDVVYYEQGGAGEERVFRPFGETSVPSIPPSDVLTLDEDYERSMISLNMVYIVQNSEPPELHPLLETCHKMPSKEILKTDEAFVFDFVTEVYVWLGRQTTSVQRKTIQALAKAKFDSGYFKPAVVNTYAHLHGRARRISLQTESIAHGRRGSGSRRVSLHKQLHDKENLSPRPPHAIMLIMFEGAEWVLFREKFSDWPDESRIIRMKGGPQARGELIKAPPPTDIKVLDPKSALESKVKAQTCTFEGTAIERGQGRPNLGIEGYHIITKDVQVWFVTEQKHYILPPESNGQFHSGEGYVIRWEYCVVPERVMRTLTDKSQASSMGRQKCAYFFWLGNDCSVTEQAATAVMTVELDKEKGPQVRVLMGKEPPCLLNIFNGGMIIHAGKRPLQGVRKHFTDRSQIRLYCVRNEIPNEACLLQVPVSAESLRSRSSYILLLCGQGEIFVWHGCKANEGTRSAALQAARRLIEQHPAEAALADKTQIGISILEEGHEPEVFWVALGGEEDYGSLLLDLQTNWDFTPRLFHLSSSTGDFVAHEVACPSISEKYSCSFPFLQDDLYNFSQPSIFLLDAHNEVYLWLGWWPDDEEGEITSSMYTRWDIEKRKAMESALEYSKAAGRPLSHTYVVYAGLEPESFIWLFPYWVVQEDITDIQIEEGREPEEKILITEEIKIFSQDTYSLEDLRVRPLPQGVDPTKLETYLSDADFKTLFKMERQEFLSLPTWKKANIKKGVGLY